MRVYIDSACGPTATTGTMSFEGLTDVLYTLEPPWEENRKATPELQGSCVPEGIYSLLPYNSPVHGHTWCLHNPDLNVYGTEPVPPGGRDHCEIHSLNFAHQSEACIGVGLENKPMVDPATDVTEPAIEDSRAAMAKLLTILGPMSQGHTLTITRETE
jgi:Family of unknown function (DUF5675)